MERRRFKPCLTSVVMGNVQSLSNKMDELTALTRSHTEYWECSLMCFTETWLHRDISDQNVSVDGFHTVLSDRDCTESGKRKGGGLAVLVNSRWCKPGHITIKEQLCCPDVELLAIAHIICLERSHMSSLLSCTSLPLQTQHLPAALYTPASPSSSCRVVTTSPWIQFCQHLNNT